MVHDELGFNSDVLQGLTDLFNMLARATNP